MTSITIDIDSSAVNAALARLSQRVTNLTPAMREIGENIASEVDLTFRDTQDPYGNPWQALKKPRRDGSSKPLNDTGNLKGSITSSPSRDSVEIGTTEDYGATHQFGRDAIPARPFLPNAAQGLPAEWEQDIVAIITRHLDAAS